MPIVVLVLIIIQAEPAKKVVDGAVLSKGRVARQPNPHTRLGLSWPIWAYLGLSGPIWAYLGRPTLGELKYCKIRVGTAFGHPLQTHPGRAQVL